jgi:hypothetical protein
MKWCTHVSSAVIMDSRSSFHFPLNR